MDNTPWLFFAQHLAQGLNKIDKREIWAILTSGCPPLPRNVHGMEWEYRRMFERDYWKNDDEKSRQVELLDASEGGEVTDGNVEDEDED
jgi:hypothetical protein